MKRLIVSSAVVLMCAMSLAALAARQKVDKTKVAARDGFVKIIVVRGRLKVEGWDQNKVRVTGRLDADTKQFIFDVDKNSTTIAVRLPEGISGSWWHNDGSNLVVRVPKHSQLNISGVSTDTTVDGIDGGVVAGSVSGDLQVDSVKHRVRLESVSGDVHLRHATGRTTVKTVSGDVSVYDSKGSLKLHSVSGDVIGHKVSDEMDLQSISGDIDMEDVHYKHISASSVSGDVDISGQMEPAAGLHVDNVSGSIHLVFHGKLDARFDLNAGSGDIRNSLSSDKPTRSRYSRDETLQFIAGDGKGDVTATTRSGGITLVRN